MPDQSPEYLYPRSETLTQLLSLVRSAFLTPEAPEAELMALESALLARESRGVGSYGITLDQQRLGSPDFWLRMAREELLDGLMYIQKARMRAEADRAEGRTAPDDRDLRELLFGLVAIAMQTLPLSDARALEVVRERGVNPKLFPPCDLKSESQAD